MPPSRPPYRPISDYALIGNTHSAALVASDGAIDWCCLPHFDSGALFCRLLDADKGGFFRVGPAGTFEASRRYGDGTAVLETEFGTSGGRARLTDFMHSQRIVHSRLGRDDPHCHRLLRKLEGLAGEVELEIVFRPTFDFARRAASLEATAGGVRAGSAGERLVLRCEPACRFAIAGDTACAHVRLRAGDCCWVVASHTAAHEDESALDGLDLEALLDETRRRWREWEGGCSHEGPFAHTVRLSARVLKLLTFGPSGALVAAPTTSLPEAIGGVRNWDYRFCWLRDAALVLHALMSIGYREAAMDFFLWLEGLCDRGSGEMQIMYRLDGGRELPERELRHLAGYQGSAPVRLGNAAAQQVQHDVYGHVLDAAYICMEAMEPPIRPGLLRVLRHLADQAAARWHEPDQGLWEARCEPRHFLSSKLMCWVALDRALRLAAKGKLSGDVERWRRERHAVRQLILDRGYDGKAGAFTQAIGAGELDASALLMPLVGFLPAADERMRSTVERIRERLTSNGLVYRYLGGDGLAGGEATFAICSCWLADNLALQGRVDDAAELIERVVSCGSDLGLLSEQIDPASGQLLGNYPQGFTHLALIRSALTLARAQRGEPSR
jgi:GH15 family glucan-1,4-alpha-glucosidase